MSSLSCDMSTCGAPVFTCISPLLSPRHPPGEWGEVGRLKIAPGSLNTGSQNISAHESHRLSVAPSPSFPLPRVLFLLWDYEGLSLNLQADGPCTYWGHMIHVCNLSFGTSTHEQPMGKLCPLLSPTNNNHLWLISIRNDNWLAAFSRTNSESWPCGWFNNILVGYV